MLFIWCHQHPIIMQLYNMHQTIAVFWLVRLQTCFFSCLIPPVDISVGFLSAFAQFGPSEFHPRSSHHLLNPTLVQDRVRLQRVQIHWCVQQSLQHMIWNTETFFHTEPQTLDLKRRKLYSYKTSDTWSETQKTLLTQSFRHKISNMRKLYSHRAFNTWAETQKALFTQEVNTWLVFLTKVFVHGLSKRRHRHPLSDLHFLFVHFSLELLVFLIFLVTFDLQTYIVFVFLCS